MAVVEMATVVTGRAPTPKPQTLNPNSCETLVSLSELDVSPWSSLRLQPTRSTSLGHKVFVTWEFREIIHPNRSLNYTICKLVRTTKDGTFEFKKTSQFFSDSRHEYVQQDGQIDPPRDGWEVPEAG